MPVNDVTLTLAQFGFPAAMCGILFWYMDRQNKNHKDEIETLRREFEENRKAVGSLEKAIIKLIYHIDEHRKDN